MEQIREDRCLEAIPALGRMFMGRKDRAHGRRDEKHRAGLSL